MCFFCFFCTIKARKHNFNSNLNEKDIKMNKQEKQAFFSKYSQEDIIRVCAEHSIKAGEKLGVSRSFILSYLKKEQSRKRCKSNENNFKKTDSFNALQTTFFFRNMHNS